MLKIQKHNGEKWKPWFSMISKYIKYIIYNIYIYILYGGVLKLEYLQYP